MKVLTNISKLFFYIIVFTSCKKNAIEDKKNPLATLVVTNAVVGGGNVKLNSNERDSAGMYGAKAFGLAAGESEVMLYPTTGSKAPYYNNMVETEDGGVYSIFLFGQGGSVESMFMKEDIPSYYRDSTLGIRVVNLSSNATINVGTAAASSANLFSNVKFKDVTNITKIPLRSPVPSTSVTFQVKDVTSGVVLASYALPATASASFPNISVLNSRNRNLTLVIKGVIGQTTGNDAFGVFPVAYY